MTAVPPSVILSLSKDQFRAVCLQGISMNCFYHPTVAAVGICKSCNRGLCPSCAFAFDKGLACRGHCEEDVEKIIGLVDRAMERKPYTGKVMASVRRTYLLGAIFNLVIGALFLGYASYTYFQLGFSASEGLFGGMGICFLVYGLVELANALRSPRPPT